MGSKEPSLDRLQYFLLKAVNKAIRIYDLIEDGDRIALALSWGKDSRVLLELLHRRQEYARESYSLHAIHVRPSVDAPCRDLVDEDAVRSWAEERGVACTITTMEPPKGRPARPNQSPCFYCAWRRRKALFTTAQQLGCNKLAFGHHADDVAATTLLNLFYHGRLETMEAKVVFFQGALTVIRPLYLVEEKEIARYAQAAGWQPANAVCTTSLSSQRRTMERIIRIVEDTVPYAKVNLLHAVERRNDRETEAPGASSTGG